MVRRINIRPAQISLLQIDYSRCVNVVYQSDMYGFIVVENLVFGENTSLVVDPSEEKLKTEFENVKRLPLQQHY
mgnify:CR=1 FL=1